MSDLRFDVKRYLDAGWSVVPIKAGQKRPTVRSWQSKQFSPADFDPAGNVGVKLGVAGLYDVDIDCPDALVAADLLLPKTDCVSGRASKPRSHRFYRCDETDKPTAQFDGLASRTVGGKSSTMIVELRGVYPKTKEPAQTVIPPSTHESGEVVEWDGGRFEQPQRVDHDGLLRAVRNVAVSTLLAQHWPAVGRRHDCRLATAGYLHRAGLDTREIAEIVRAVAISTGSTNVQDAVDVVRDTASKLEAGHQGVTGGTSLAEMLDSGKAVIARLNRWLGREPSRDRRARNAEGFTIDQRGVVLRDQQENVSLAADRIVSVAFDLFSEEVTCLPSSKNSNVDQEFSTTKSSSD